MRVARSGRRERPRGPRAVNLLEGSPARALGRLSLPIMATSFVQMAYNLTDMFWIGWLGPLSVAAVGAAGMYMWYGEDLSIIPRMGAQVLVAQALGEGELLKARRFAALALRAGLGLGLLFAAFLALLRGPLIGLFGFSEKLTLEAGELYLLIVALGVPAAFLIRILTGLLTAAGNSQTPFRVTVLGLALNMLLDPLFIFGFGWGVAGAALATLFAQWFVLLLFAFVVRRMDLFRALPWWDFRDGTGSWRLLRIGLPAGLQGIFYTTVTALLARLLAGFGAAAVAVQRVGAQIESLSWMTAEGLGTGINAYNAQNYGAGLWRRLRSGYRSALGLVSLLGLLATLLFFAFPETIMGLFFHDAEVLRAGCRYLQILSLSQIFMCLEIMTTGAFSGYGRTDIPSAVISVLTLARLPLAYWWSATPLGTEGIWWAISSTSIAKGLILLIWFLFFQRRRIALLEVRSS